MFVCFILGFTSDSNRVQMLCPTPHGGIGTPQRCCCSGEEKSKQTKIDNFRAFSGNIKIFKNSVFFINYQKN